MEQNINERIDALEQEVKFLKEYITKNTVIESRDYQFRGRFSVFGNLPQQQKAHIPNATTTAFYDATATNATLDVLRQFGFIKSS